MQKRDGRGVRIPLEGNFLDERAWVLEPDVFRQVMTRDQFKATLLYHEGWISAKGRMLDIKGKHLGCGVYEITLREHGK